MTLDQDSNTEPLHRESYQNANHSAETDYGLIGQFILLSIAF